ncbi:MAG: sporulation integral membrane protein YtvI [Lachnospiraceae bacterium]|nr:sporulation integral membrane protein YtvI [Lachnospiraceae bacterium]
MEKKKKFIVDVTFYSLIAIIIWGICKFILPVMVPFIAAFVIASILQILVRKFCRNSEKMKKVVSILICIVFFALLFAVVVVAGAKIFNSISGFLEAIPVIYQNEIVPALGNLSDSLQVTLASLDAGIATKIDSAFQEFVNNIGNYITQFSVNAVKFISGSIVGIPGFVVRLIIMVVSTFFFMSDYDTILGFFAKCIPAGKEKTVKQVLGYVKNTIIVYLRSYSLLFLLTFVELSIGFKLLGIPYAPLIGGMVAIFDILPVLGTGGILLPWVAILFVMKNIKMAIGMLVLYLAITIIRNTVEPKLVGKQIGLHPLATLISLYLGLKLLGIVGLVLFPMTLAVLANMNQQVSLNFFKKKNSETE